MGLVTKSIQMPGLPMLGGVGLSADGLQAQPNSPFALADLPWGTVPALYVHIPFCFHKCHYCDFYSITRQTPERMGRFVDLLLRQAEEHPPWPPRTVFFGGGTPSLLPP